MRPSTLLIFVLAAVSSPVYGAPLRTTVCDRFPDACGVHARAVDESDALSLSSIFNIGRKVFGLGKTVVDGRYVSQMHRMYA